MASFSKLHTQDLIVLEEMVELINSTNYYYPLRWGDIMGIDAYGVTDEVDGLVACVTVVHQGAQAYLNHLCVVPNRRKEGLAVWLLDKVRQVLQREGVKVVHTCVAGDNGAAMKLALAHHAKIGFPYMSATVVLED